MDGAIGSLLQEQGLSMNSSIWSSAIQIESPDKLLNLHRAYVKAGADIITTNTFRSNPLAVKNFDICFDFKLLVQTAITIAKKTLQNHHILAGSNPPAEDCYSERRTISRYELEYNHKEHISTLWENNVDFILNETQSHFDEIILTSKFCSENNIPFITSIFTIDGERILSNEKLDYVIETVLDFNPICVSINCVCIDTFRKIYPLIENKTHAFYLNCGSGNFTDNSISCGTSAKEYLTQIKKYFTANLFFVGSCCGSNPNHTKEIFNYVNVQNKN